MSNREKGVQKTQEDGQRDVQECVRRDLEIQLFWFGMKGETFSCCPSDQKEGIIIIIIIIT